MFLKKQRRKMSKFEIMTISSIENYIENFGDEAKGLHSEPLRVEARKRFPYSVVVEAHYPVGDFAHRWCWQNFGPMDCKECYEHYSEYPGCPLVLAIQEYKIRKSYTDKNGVVHEYDYHTRDPGKHNHTGVWLTVWLGKTGYDYGFTEYYFQNEIDRDLFVKEAPNFGLGENYED
jgi:hypothetical protein